MDPTNGKVYIVWSKSSKSNIFIYDPSIDAFGDVYQTGVNKMIYGIAANGDIIYMAISMSGSTFLGFKAYNVQSPSDTDINYPLTKVVDSLALSLDFSLVDSTQIVSGAVYALSNSIPTTLTTTAINTITNSPSYNSSGTWDIADPPPTPAPTPTPTPSPTPATISSPASTPTSSASSQSSANSSQTSQSDITTRNGKYAIWIAAFLTFIFSIIYSMSEDGSFQSFWSLMNDYQLYQALLLLGVYMPDKLIEFFTSFSFSTFSFSFLDAVLPFDIQSWFNDFQIKQLNAIYTKIGLKYSSVFLNEIFLLLVLLFIMITDAVFFPIFWCWYNKLSGWKRKIAEKTMRFYRFSVYIRLAIQSFLFVLISWNNEFNYYLNGGKINYLSSSFALFYTIIIIIFLVFVIVHYITTSWRKQIIHVDTYWKELYSDIKYTKSWRSYSTIFFFKKNCNIVMGCVFSWSLWSYYNYRMI